MAEVIKTVKSSGGDYSSLSAWEAAEQADLVAAGNIAIAECFNFEDTTKVLIDGWTTDASNHIIVRAPSAERHDGTAGTGFRLKAGAAGHNLEVRQDYTRIEYIESHLDSNTSSDEGIRVVGDNCLIDGCIIWTNKEVTAQDGVYASTAITFTVRNSAIYGFFRAGVHTQNESAQTINVVLENCTIFDCGDTTQTFSACVMCFTNHASAITNCSVKNTIAMNSEVTDYREGDGGSPGTVNWSGSNNIASDTSATGKFTGSFDSRTATVSTTPGAGDWVVFTNITATTEDFHLQSSAENDAEGAGVDLSGTFTNDIDGDTRLTPWDIGADAFPAAHTGTGAVTMPQVTVSGSGVRRIMGTGAITLPSLGVGGTGVIGRDEGARGKTHLIIGTGL